MLTKSLKKFFITVYHHFPLNNSGVLVTEHNESSDTIGTIVILTFGRTRASFILNEVMPPAAAPC